MKRIAAAALLLALAVSSTGCRSLLPHDDDSTLTSVAKGVIWVPVMLGVVIADGMCEDAYSVSPVDVVTGRDCSGDDDWDRESSRAYDRALTDRDLRRGP